MNIEYRNLIIDNITDIYASDIENVILELIRENIEGKCYDGFYIKKVHSILDFSPLMCDPVQNTHIINIDSVIFNAEVYRYNLNDMLVGCEVMEGTEGRSIVHARKNGLIIDTNLNNIVDKVYKGMLINIRVDRVLYLPFRLPKIRGSIEFHVVKSPVYLTIEGDFNEYLPIIEDLDRQLSEINPAQLNFMKEKLYPFKTKFDLKSKSIFESTGDIYFSPVIDLYKMEVMEAGPDAIIKKEEDPKKYIMDVFIDYRKTLLEMCQTYVIEDNLKLWEYFDRSKELFEIKLQNS